MTPSPPALFLCPHRPGGLRLTPGACARSWSTARKLPPELQAGIACTTCPIGAAHAGATTEPKALPPDACPWCGAQGRRKVLNRAICISCYNRVRELAHGVNARGTYPHGSKLILFRVGIADAPPGTCPRP